MSTRPEPFEYTTTAQLWTDAHRSQQMLAAHLDPLADRSSYPAEFIRRCVTWLIERFDIGTAHHIADFGCGPGLYGNALARSGASVTGLDIAQRSVDHANATARSQRLPAHYVRRDYLSYSSRERYDLIIMIMRDYSALSPADRSRLLDTVGAHLADGGAFVFDVDSAAAFAEVDEHAEYAPSLMDGFWSDRPYFGFHHTFRYPRELVSLDRYDIVEDDRTETFYNWIQYFTPDGLRAELRERGFATDVIGDVAGAGYSPEASQFAAIATLRD